MKSRTAWLLVALVITVGALVILPLLLVFTQDPDRLEKLMDASKIRVDIAEKPDRSHDMSDSAEDTDQIKGSPFKCPPYFYLCDESSNFYGKSLCILRDLHCNNHTDCPLGDDEHNCVYVSSEVRSLFNRTALATNRTADEIRRSATYHVNCSHDDVVDGKCPCHAGHDKKAICKNWNLTAIPDIFKPSILALNLDDNSISELDNYVLNKYRLLITLSLRRNQIRVCGAYAFRGLENLKRLYLQGNMISTVNPDAFYGLFSLQKIYLNDNLLENLPLAAFAKNLNITLLDFAQNLLDFNDDQQFPTLDKLDWIDLDDNRLTVISPKLFAPLTHLTKLNLKGNQIASIAPSAFQQNRKLFELDLGHNQLSELDQRTFDGLVEMKTLLLNDNPSIRSLPRTLFTDLKQLQQLQLHGLTIANMDIDLLASNANLTNVTFSRFRYCLFAPKVRHCYPPSDGVSSLQHLLIYPILRAAIWLVAFVTCVGNLTVLLWRSLSDMEDAVLSIFVKNLSVADFFMGVYLAIIGVHDLDFADKYLHRAFGWMSSWQCSAAGFLAMLSSEMSVLILTLLAIERYRTITSAHRVVTLTSAKISLTLAWLLAIVAATYPLVHWSDTSTGYYGSNSLCFPLHINEPLSLGWQFSAIVIIGFNFTAVVTILTLYFRLFLVVSRDRQFSRPGAGNNRREDAVLALRFFFIVLTDCLCWLPIVAIKMLAFSGSQINPTVYAWVVVFVLPINSAINPIIYTLAAPSGLSKRSYKSLSNFCARTKCFFVPRGHRLDSSVVANGASTGDHNLSSSLYSQISDLTHLGTARSSQGSVLSLSVLKHAPSVERISRRGSFPQSVQSNLGTVGTFHNNQIKRAFDVKHANEASEL